MERQVLLARLLEELGINGATTVSFAAATFGLVMGSFIGGFVAKNLIENYKLKTPKEFKSIILFLLVIFMRIIKLYFVIISL